MKIKRKESVVARLRAYGNRKRTSWEAAALCVAAVSQIERDFGHMWRFAQGAEDPKGYAKSVLAEMGIDFDKEQARLSQPAQVFADADGNGAGAKVLNAVPKGHFWLGVLNADLCRSCGCLYSKHTRVNDAMLCPVDRPLKSEHTKGPWRLDQPHYSPQLVDDRYHCVEAGCGFYSDDPTYDGFSIWGLMSPANAKLIAAAPELLEACRRISDAAYHVPLGELEFLRAAIAKATT